MELNQDAGESVPETSPPQINANGAAAPQIPGADPQKRGRGRPKGSGNKAPLGETSVGGAGAGRKARPQIEYDRDAIARQLMGTHFLIGTAFGAPELFLTEKESIELAEVMIGFAREYDFAPDSKVMALVNLAATAGFIYIPKLIAAAKRIKEMKVAQAHTFEGVATEVKPHGATGN